MKLLRASILVVLCISVAQNSAAETAEEFFSKPPSFEPMFLAKSETKLPERVQRIVTVAPSVTELIFALGAGDRVIGVSRYDDFPKEVEKLPKVGGFLDPNIEAIVALKPDLVVGVPNAGNRPVLERIARMGVAVLIVPGNGLQDIEHSLAILGRVLGPEAAQRSAELVSRIHREVHDLHARISTRARPRVAFVYGTNPLILAGPGSFADALLVLLNADNVASEGTAYPQYALEKLVEARPDVIIDASVAHGDRRSGPWLKFKSIPAVQTGRVHALPAGDVLRPGPRIVDGMRMIADLLHPPEAPANGKKTGDISEFEKRGSRADKRD